MSRRTRFSVIILIILGILTLAPIGTSKQCFLGYFAHCPFTPISTIILWAIAGAIYWREKTEKTKKN